MGFHVARHLFPQALRSSLQHSGAEWACVPQLQMLQMNKGTHTHARTDARAHAHTLTRSHAYTLARARSRTHLFNWSLRLLNDDPKLVPCERCDVWVQVARHRAVHAVAIAVDFQGPCRSPTPPAAATAAAAACRGWCSRLLAWLLVLLWPVDLRGCRRRCQPWASGGGGGGGVVRCLPRALFVRERRRRPCRSPVCRWRRCGSCWLAAAGCAAATWHLPGRRGQVALISTASSCWCCCRATT